MSKRPAFMFYPGDWMKDPALRACSAAARGLWMDMLCLMHECPHRGFLETASGEPYTAEDIAHMTGCHADEVQSLLALLSRYKVVKQTASGTLYSSRLERDTVVRQQYRERQRKHRKGVKTKKPGHAKEPRDKSVREPPPVIPLSRLSSYAFTDISVTHEVSDADVTEKPSLSEESGRPNGAAAPLAPDGASSPSPAPASLELPPTALDIYPPDVREAIKLFIQEHKMPEQRQEVKHHEPNSDTKSVARRSPEGTRPPTRKQSTRTTR